MKIRSCQTLIPSSKRFSVKAIAMAFVLSMAANGHGFQQEAGASKAPTDDLQGEFIPNRSDYAFAFASTNRSLYGIAFHLQPKSTQTVTGTVLSETGKPVANAEVWFTSIIGRIPMRELVLTDSDGKFSHKLPNDPQLKSPRWSITAIHGDSISDSIINPTQAIYLTLAKGRKVSFEPFEIDSSNQTKKPINDFSVHLGDGRIIHSQGKNPLVINGVRSGQQNLGITAPGYASWTAKVDLWEDREWTWSEELAKGTTVTGLIVDENEVPHPLNDVYIDGFNRVIGHAITDREGKFQLSGIPMNRQVAIYATSFFKDNGMSSVGDSIFVEPNEQPPELRLMVTPSFEEPPPQNGMPMVKMNAMPGIAAPKQGFLCGEIRLPDGSPCTSFLIRATASNTQKRNRNVDLDVRTIAFRNTKGNFVLSGGVAHNAYRVTVYSPGYMDTVIDPVMSITEDQLSNPDAVQFILEPAISDKVKVVDSKGKAIPGARIQLFRGDPKRQIFLGYAKSHAVAVTDESGFANMDSLSITSGRAVVSAPGFVETQFPWKAGAGEDFELAAGLSLNLKLVGSEKLNGPVLLVITAENGTSIESPVLKIKNGTLVWNVENVAPGKLKIACFPFFNKNIRFIVDGEVTETASIALRDADSKSVEVSLDVVAEGRSEVDSK